MSEPTCDYPTADDTPCKNATTDDGDADRCWIDGHNSQPVEADQPGRKREPPSRETQEKIASVIEAGGSLREAARKAGVHREQINRWMEYGDEEDAGPFQEFRDRLVRARGEGEGQYRKALIQIAKENNDTATLMSMLKQRYPDSWGDVDRGEQAGGVVVNTSAGETVEIDPDTLEVQD